MLDEPNSNLDSIGEEALLTTLDVLKQDKVTVVIVAHRPSILSGVDKILVLRADGSPEAYGPRAEVMQQFTRRGAPQQPQPSAPRNVVALPVSPDHGAKS